mmetsp:Transcript_60591/g.141126  ORF Transcript_60591/g.141126 Transcript_60591/m.141126 type:complete len:101 (+) Transcript_60591:322-624(+)
MGVFDEVIAGCLWILERHPDGGIHSTLGARFPAFWALDRVSCTVLKQQQLFKPWQLWLCAGTVRVFRPECLHKSPLLEIAQSPQPWSLAWLSHFLPQASA